MTHDLDDGVMTFKFRSGGKEIEGSIDLLILNVACNEVQQMHQLQPMPDQPGMVSATSDFLVALAAKLGKLWTTSEEVKMSPTIANWLWAQASTAIADVKKNTSEVPKSPFGQDSTHSNQSDQKQDSPLGAQTPEQSPTNKESGCC